MADGTTTITVPIPAPALARLIAAEYRQRRETIKRKLPAVAISVLGLLMLQRFKCGCGCGEPLDFEAAWDPKTPPPGFPVIAHRLSRGSKGGHVVGNVFIDRFACNKRDAGPDTSGAASVKRFSPDYQKRLLAKDEPENGSRLKSSRVIKSNPEIASRPLGNWPKRKFPSATRKASR